PRRATGMAGRRRPPDRGLLLPVLGATAHERREAGVSTDRHLHAVPPAEDAKVGEPARAGRTRRDVARRGATGAKLGLRLAEEQRAQPPDRLQLVSDRARASGSPSPLSANHEAFVDWFVSYWRRRGARPFAERAEDEAAA